MTTTSGGPGRALEMTSLKYTNVQEGQRNIFVFDGQVMFVTDYEKTQGIAMTQKAHEILTLS
jgi:hypothetical protein